LPACAFRAEGAVGVGAFPPSGGRKRWAGINPQNPLDFAQSGFGFRPANTTKEDLIISNLLKNSVGF